MRMFFIRFRSATVAPIAAIVGICGVVSASAAARNTTVQYENAAGRAVPYEIVRADDYSIKALQGSLSDYSSQELSNLPIDRRVTFRVVVPPTITKEEVRPTIDRIISYLTSRDSDIDEIGLFIYSDKRYVSGQYNVAMATWAPNGVWGSVTPEIARSNDRSSYKLQVTIKPNFEALLKEPDKQLGLSMSARMQIFKAEVAAEDRSMNEADKTYPPTDRQSTEKNTALSAKLLKTYKAHILHKYRITDDQLSRIGMEGATKGWPMH